MVCTTVIVVDVYSTPERLVDKVDEAENGTLGLMCVIAVSRHEGSIDIGYLVQTPECVADADALKAHAGPVAPGSSFVDDRDCEADAEALRE